jgi:probable DNA metabolism protein
MIIWQYDKTFEGFLTLVFDGYDLKLFPDKILGPNQSDLFRDNANHQVVTDEVKAKRVWDGLLKKTSAENGQMFYRVFLSELDGVELLMLNYVKAVFASPINMELNFGNPHVLEMVKIGQKVGREAHRIPMFIRFQKTIDDIYYASFDPQYNVLPLAIDHFEKRFADQKWIIYDTRRNYGFYYDLETTTEVTFTQSMIDPKSGKIAPSVMAEDEQLFQELWKSYFKSMCIKERINPKLHRQLLPKRFWKYLTEKQ